METGQAALPEGARAQPRAYLLFFGFLVSFLGLLSLATEILPYPDDYNRILALVANSQRLTVADATTPPRPELLEPRHMAAGGPCDYRAAAFQRAKRGV